MNEYSGLFKPIPSSLDKIQQLFKNKNIYWRSGCGCDEMTSFCIYFTYIMHILCIYCCANIVQVLDKYLANNVQVNIVQILCKYCVYIVHIFGEYSATFECVQVNP